MSVSRSMESPNPNGVQLELFDSRLEPFVCGEGGAGVSSAAALAERQLNPAAFEQRALAQGLMERVASLANLEKAVRRVVSNKGSPGVDGMSVGDLKTWFAGHFGELQKQLLEGAFRPQEIKGIQIPKPGGGMRQLGVPTAVDRVVQQAILQVLDPLLDPTFSESSFGFRPLRSAHQALRQAQRYVAEGRVIVVDMDLEKFFDRVNHDVVMARLARRIGDKILLRLIRRFLEAGMLQDGVRIRRHMGTPQGGPLSPLLANLLLDDLDKELERRGHKFCRYADDCNIYVRSRRSGERVLSSITKFLEQHLKLQVNRGKSAVDHVENRQFLGYRLLRKGDLGIAPKSLKRAKDRVREITRRNRGHVKVKSMIKSLNEFISGWVQYFRLARCQSALKDLGGWIRRKLRCVILKRCKRAKTISSFLVKLGVPWDRSWTTAACGKGWWRMSHLPATQQGMSVKWFVKVGLLDPLGKYESLSH
ncbi:MAG: group II intron reverse transcriptase/maturase [Candidatus Sumerlaeota bacterium]